MEKWWTSGRRCGREMVERWETAGGFARKSHLRNRVIYVIEILKIYHLVNIECLIWGSTEKITLPGSPPKAAMFSCTHSKAALWLSQMRGDKKQKLSICWRNSTKVGNTYWGTKNLVPESSIARSLLHSQREKSQWAESVVDCHLLCSISVTATTKNNNERAEL